MNDLGPVRESGRPDRSGKKRTGPPETWSNVCFILTYVICSLNSSNLLLDDRPTSEEESEDKEAEPELIENEDIPHFEPDDDVSEAEDELTDMEQAVMKEINEKEMEADVDTFLQRTENDNTRATTDAILSKYNRIVAKKQNKKFVTLAETPREQISNILARFFKMIRTKKGTVYNASSLNTFLSSFGRYFAERFDPPIDMKNDISFRQVRTTLLARMKKEAQATKDKKPGSNASRATGLRCRAVREVHAVTNGSLIFGPIGFDGVPEYIELNEQWVTKNRVGRDARLLEARVNPDHDHPDNCHIRTIIEMILWLMKSGSKITMLENTQLKRC